MTHLRSTAIALAATCAAFTGSALGQEALSSYQAIVSVADQKLAVLRDGQVVAKYPISTSRFGVGDNAGSYKTPLGKLKVCEKLGDNLPSGAVIKHRRATGEVLTVNAPGRDPIVTRILWLDGTEPGNANAKDRSIYIHGTPEERNIGRPASYGCIRMRSEDVVALYKELNVGATVSVIQDKLPRLAKYTEPKAEVVKTTAPDKASPKVLAAMAEAKEQQERAARKEEADRLAKAQADQAAKVAAERQAETERLARVDRLAKEERDRAAREALRSAQTAPRIVRVEETSKPAPVAPVTPARQEKPAAVAAAKVNAGTAKPEIAAPIASLDKPARAVKPPKTEKPSGPAVVAQVASTEKTTPAAAAEYSAARMAVAKKRLAAPQPVEVPAPVDPDRLQFLRSHEASLASARSAEAPSADLSERMKGSILDTGLQNRAR